MIVTESLKPEEFEFRQPAEWEWHEAVWLAWPSHGELWQENLPGAQAEFRAFCQAIADLDPVTGIPRGERMNILVPHNEARIEAARQLSGLPVRFHEIPFGDIWLRDTAPIFLKGSRGRKATASFRFNGWGGKYDLPHDPEVSARVALASGLPAFTFPWILEGGSVEVDGDGTCLTTRQCLLNKNRNSGMTESDIERGLRDVLGVSKVLWFGDGLLNDHTDGHIDTIARFSTPGVVLLMRAVDRDDPNRDVLEALVKEAKSMVDARGRKLELRFVPSPGAVLDEDGRLMPASYLNFYLSNTSVIVPTYGSRYDQEAVRAIAACFPDRQTVGLSAKAILSGGGAFHCISQQQPA